MSIPKTIATVMSCNKHRAKDLWIPGHFLAIFFLGVGLRVGFFELALPLPLGGRQVLPGLRIRLDQPAGPFGHCAVQPGHLFVLPGLSLAHPATAAIFMSLRDFNDVSGGSADDISSSIGTQGDSLTVLPEPAALMLLGVAGVMLIGRRRRRTPA